MLQARIHGPDDVRLDEVPEPRAGSRDAVVRVAECGICGSDLGYIRLGGLIGPGPEPMAIGHELAGVVHQVGEEVERFRPGDRVVLNPSPPAGGPVIGNGASEGGFAPLLLVRDVDGVAGAARLHPLPDTMPFEIGALAEPLGVGMNAVDKLTVEPGSKVVVFGAGPIGLAAVASLHHRGVDDVIAVDLSATRLELARRLGARETVAVGDGEVWKRLRDLHGVVDLMGGPVVATDAFVEASGAPAVIQQVLGGARRGARLSVVALHREPVSVNFLDVLMRELQINGAMEYPDDFGRTVDVLAHDDLSSMITHRFPLDRFDEALAVAADADVAGKVMIEIAPTPHQAESP
ncbi:MAG: alcohol dehydrogenase catalytic domain-containing protein [Acidimicrobiia bacterium]|nr:alcohol dehydrogenase catalytic domain-containing protein [Acidimicrobiia bacterium]